nr:hypothetical protein GCM10025699_63330 [Microbacterium flavescens]
MPAERGGQIGQLRSGRVVDAAGDDRAGGSGLDEQALQVGEGGLRRRDLRHLGGSGGRRVAQHPEHVAQLAEGRLRVVAHDARRGDDLVDAELAPSVLERPGVQGDERQAVPQHVVHLAGDPGALVVADPLLAQRLLAFGEAGPLEQGGDEIAAAADRDPHGDEQRVDEDDDDDQLPGGQRARRRREHRGLREPGRGEEDHADRRDLAGASSRRERDQRQDGGTGGDGRHARERRQDERDDEGRPAAEHDEHQGGQPARQVAHHSDAEPGVAPAGRVDLGPDDGEGEDADQGRQGDAPGLGPDPTTPGGAGHGSRAGPRAQRGRGGCRRRPREGRGARRGRCGCRHDHEPRERPVRAGSAEGRSSTEGKGLRVPTTRSPGRPAAR